MGKESESGEEGSKQSGSNAIMNDRTSGRQGAGVRQQDQSASGPLQRGGTQGNDVDSEAYEKESS